MKEHNLLNVEKNTNNKYLNYYTAHYSNKVDYYFVSRRNEQDLAINNPKKTYADAVRILPYFIENGRVYVALIKEFRYAINRYVYGTPAGCVEKGENQRATAIREVYEEIGAKVKKIKKVAGPLYTSAGLTDETILFYEAEISKPSVQHLEEGEDINVVICPLTKLLTALKTKEFCLQSRLHLEAFYYKCKANGIEK